MLSKPLRLGAAKPLRTELMPRSDFHSVNMNATRSFFSWGVNFVPRIKLKNSTVSSKVTTVRLNVEENQLVNAFGEFGICLGGLKGA